MTSLTGDTPRCYTVVVDVTPHEGTPVLIFWLGLMVIGAGLVISVRLYSARHPWQPVSLCEPCMMGTPCQEHRDHEDLDYFWQW